MSASPENIRADQQREGRDREGTISARPRPPFNHTGSSSPRPARKPFVPKGHDAILHRLQEAGGELQVTTLAGELFTGKLVARDKFTITIHIAGATTPMTFYKHGIESFVPVPKEVA